MTQWEAVQPQYAHDQVSTYRIVLPGNLFICVSRASLYDRYGTGWRISVGNVDVGTMSDLDLAKSVAVGAARAILQKALRDLDEVG